MAFARSIFSLESARGSQLYDWLFTASFTRTPRGPLCILKESWEGHQHVVRSKSGVSVERYLERYLVIYVVARRHIFVCFMPKSAFWRAFSTLDPYTGVGPI